MLYIEWLRVRGALRNLGILLGILFLIAVAARIALGVESAQYNWIYNDQGKPGVHVVTQRLADGTLRTTMNDPLHGAHVVIDDRGWNGRSITITGRDISSDNDVHVQVGAIGVQALKSTPTESSIQINTDVPVAIDWFLMFAAFVALVIGTRFAGPLARENNNHLEVAWTKPISRESYALRAFGIDFGGLLLSMAMTIVVLIICMALFEWPHLITDSQTLQVLVLSIVTPLAWYALLTACSASLRRGTGAVAWIGWIVGLVLPGVALSLVHVDLATVHAAGVVLSCVALLDPLAYIHLGTSSGPDSGSAIGVLFGALATSSFLRIVILLVLTVLYSALSLVQWRRLEA